MADLKRGFYSKSLSRKKTFRPRSRILLGSQFYTYFTLWGCSYAIVPSHYGDFGCGGNAAALAPGLGGMRFLTRLSGGGCSLGRGDAHTLIHKCSVQAHPKGWEEISRSYPLATARGSEPRAARTKQSRCV